MLRAIEDVAHRPLLDHAAGVHHHDPVAESGNDAEVVGDHDDGGAEIALQVGQQIEDLRLDGDVEGGGRLVGDQQVRLAEQRHGNHHALAHTAGEIVRVEDEALPGRGDADAVQQQIGRAHVCTPVTNAHN